MIGWLSHVTGIRIQTLLVNQFCLREALVSGELEQ